MRYPRFRSPAARRLAERAMVRGLGPRQTRRMDRALRESPADRAEYDRLTRLFRALEGDPPLASGQHERILAGVLESVGSRPEPTGGLGLLRLAPALPALLLVLLVGGLHLGLPGPRPAPTPRGSELAARGRGGHSGLLRGKVGVLPFCIREGVVQKTPPRYDQGDTPGARCQLGDELQLMVTHTAGYRHLLVVGQLMATGGGPDLLTWYYPAPPTGSSGLAPARSEYTPLGQAIRLGVNHRPGEVRLVAIFSRRPIQAEEVFAWLTTLDRRASSEAMLDSLGGGKMESVEARVFISKGAP